jgi:hypothetical protein
MERFAFTVRLLLMFPLFVQNKRPCTRAIDKAGQGWIQIKTVKMVISYLFRADYTQEKEHIVGGKWKKIWLDD